MNELEERLQEDLAAAADAADLDAPALADVMRTVHRAQRHRRLRYKVAVAAVAVPLVAVAVSQLVGITVDDPTPTADTTITTPDPTTTSSSTTTTSDPTTTTTTGSTDSGSGSAGTGPTGAGTSPVVPSASGLVLAPDGLGDVRFGDPEGEVIATLSQRFGQPVDDTIYPYTGCRPDEKCPPECNSNTIIRRVTWRGLATWYSGSNGDFTFVAWSATAESGLATGEGLRLGDSLDRVREVYGDRVTVKWFEYAPGAGMNYVTIRLPEGRMAGYATKDALSSLTSGQSCERGD